MEIKQSDLTAAQAAKLTREFRCPPQEQMKALLAFRKEDMEIDDPTKIECPCSDELRQVLWTFHIELLSHCGHPGPIVRYHSTFSQQKYFCHTLKTQKKACMNSNHYLLVILKN